jgi:PAS domain S-box-containing protein
MKRERGLKLFPFRSASAITSIIIIVAAALVYFRWLFNIEFLNHISLGPVRMKPFTGLCFSASGLALLLLYFNSRWTKYLSISVSLIIIVISILSLLEFALLKDFGIENIIFRKDNYPHTFPGMMSFNTSVCIMLTGFILIFLASKPNRFSYLAAFMTILVFTVGFIGFLGLFGGLSEFSESTGFHNMSAFTSILLIIISIGILFYYLSYSTLKISIEQKFFALSVFIFSILVFITLLINTEFRSLREENQIVENSRIVKTRLNQIFSCVLDVETSVRGFLLSSDENYLEFIEKANEKMIKSFNDLNDILKEDPVQKSRLDTLNKLVFQRFDHAESIKKATQDKGTGAGIKIFLSNKGKFLTDKIRAVVDQMIENENSKIYQSHLSEDEKAYKVKSFIYINMTIEVSLLFLFFRFLVRNIRKRKEAVDEILLLNQQLDEKVRIRTAELQDSEVKYRDIVESALVGVFTVDFSGKIIYSNDAFARIFEYETGTTIESETSNRFLWDNETQKSFTEKLKANGFVKDFESDVITRKGKTKIVQISAKMRGEKITGMLYDITERKKAEIALEESESKLRLIMENSADVILLIDIQSRVLYSNLASTKMLGYSAAEIEGMTVTDLSSDNFKEVVGEKILKLLEDGRLFTEWSILTKEKKVVSVEMNSVVLPDGNIFASLRDITERKAAEMALLESERKLRSILDNSSDTVFIADKQGRYLYVNKAAEIMTGFSQKELLKMSFVDVFPGEKDSFISEIFKTLLEKGFLNIERVFIRKDGEKIQTDIHAVVLPEGTIYGSIRDITLRKTEQEELLRHRNHLEEIVKERTKEIQLYLSEIEDLYDNAPCGYHSLDENGIYVKINNTELSWLGYTREEILGKKGTINFLTPESQEKQKIVFPEFKKTGSANGLELEFIRKDGSTFIGMLNATAIYDSSGNFIMSRSILTDITNIKQYERALHKAKKEADDANRVKSEFLANMSHEIRTPMNAVLGYTELLGVTPLDQRQKGYIQSIISSGKSLLTLINDILDLSKIEAGKLDLDYNYIDTETFFAEFENVFSLKLAEKNLELIIDIQSGTPRGLYLDESRVRQIMLNLIGNAIKFTSKGSITVMVMIEKPTFGKNINGNPTDVVNLIIKVKDTGIGISQKMIKTIFEPFIQEHNFKTFGGTGLGLTITQRLIKLMNGSISVESEENQGSIFTVFIPDVPFTTDVANQEFLAPFKPEDIVFEKSLILVADDVAHNRQYLCDALQNTNVRLIEAENGGEAYKIALKELPDLIITDIVMPETDGFQLLEKLKKNKKTRHIPVIAYSASVLKEKKEKILHSDFACLLIKPVKLMQLYSALMKYLPYTIISNSTESSPKNKSGKNQKLKKANELINIIDTELNIKWQTLTVKQPIKDINEFGTRLEQLGKIHNSLILEKFGGELINAATNFKIQAILELINKYPAVIREIKTLAYNDDNK